MSVRAGQMSASIPVCPLLLRRWSSVHSPPSSFTALFLCIVCSLGSVQVSGKALQHGPPGQVFVAAGKDGYLQCHTKASAVTTREWSRVDGSSSFTVSAVRDGTALEKETSAEYRGRVEQADDGTLKIGKVTHRDSGTYKCNALGESAEEVFVSLVVAQVSEVHLTVDNSSTEPLVRCECSGWGPKPQISLKDDEENDLQAETSSSDGPDDFYTVRAHMDLAAVKRKLKSGRLLNCRAEIPGMSLVMEKTMQISDLADHLSRPDAPESHVWVTGIVLACVVVVVVGFLVAVWKIERLQPLKEYIQRLIPSVAKAEEAVPLLRDYRDISKLKTRGASKDMAKAHIRLDYGQPLDGVRASEVLAERDLDRMNNYKEIINSVGTSEDIHPGLIAAVISRQSGAGATLDKNSGCGRWDSNCFGLMQIHKTYHPGCDRCGPYSKEHVEQGTRFLASLIQIMARERKSWTKEEQLIGALACYIAGDGKVLNLKEDEDVDSVTPYEDFANDVVARAKWFAGRGYTFNA